MSAKESAVTGAAGTEGLLGARGVAGSMLGTFLCDETKGADDILRDVCDAEARDGDIRGEIVGGCKGELTNSKEFGELCISGNTSAPKKVGVAIYLGDPSGDAWNSISPLNVAAGCRRGGRGISPFEYTLAEYSVFEDLSFLRKKSSKISSGGVFGL